MRPPPESRNAGLAPGVGMERQPKSGSHLSSLSRRAAQQLVATISTGHASQVRLHLSTWREQTKLDLKPYSATVPQCFMPCGPGISIDIEQLPELLKAIVAAEAEARSRGLL